MVPVLTLALFFLSGCDGFNKKVSGNAACMAFNSKARQFFGTTVHAFMREPGSCLTCHTPGGTGPSHFARPDFAGAYGEARSRLNVNSPDSSALMYGTNGHCGPNCNATRDPDRFAQLLASWADNELKTIDAIAQCNAGQDVGEPEPFVPDPNARKAYKVAATIPIGQALAANGVSIGEADLTTVATVQVPLDAVPNGAGLVLTFSMRRFSVFDSTGPGSYFISNPRLITGRSVVIKDIRISIENGTARHVSTIFNAVDRTVAPVAAPGTQLSTSTDVLVRQGASGDTFKVEVLSIQ